MKTLPQHIRLASDVMEHIRRTAEIAKVPVGTVVSVMLAMIVAQSQDKNVQAPKKRARRR